MFVDRFFISHFLVSRFFSIASLSIASLSVAFDAITRFLNLAQILMDKFHRD
jgi:hypothetical protein